MIIEKELYDDIVEKLLDDYNYNEKEAKKWADKHIEDILEEMFDAESKYIDRHARNRYE